MKIRLAVVPLMLGSLALAASVSPPGGGPCLRDQYVAAAELDAFGTEAYFRQANTSVVTGYANDMTAKLQSPYARCSSTPVVGQGSNCATLRYVSSTDLASMLS
jgi:hypothetical protein